MDASDITEPLPLLSLTVENHRGIRCARLDFGPGEPLIGISGDNAHGKSSLLNGLAIILEGKRAASSEPVRRGAKKSVTRADWGAFNITSTFTPSGRHALQVRDGNGDDIKSPRTFLDALTGRSADPVGWLGQDDVRQREQLCAIAGIDVSDLDARHEGVYADRTAINRQVKELRALADTAETYPGAPDAEMSASDLMTELDEATEAQAEAVALGTAADDLTRELGRTREDFADVEQELKRLTERRALLSDSVIKFEARAEDAAEAAVEAGSAVPDRQEIQERLRTIEDTNRKVRANQAAATTRGGLRAAQNESDSLTAELGQIAEERAARIRDADYPVDGLSVDDAGVLYRGIPLRQASGAERIRVACGVSLAARPLLPIIIIDEGSGVDQAGMDQIREAAREHGAQVLVARIQVDDFTTIEIVDGEVAA